jgi:hypothetical protein
MQIQMIVRFVLSEKYFLVHLQSGILQSVWVSSSVVEQWPFKPLAVGSIPTSPTKKCFAYQ